MYESEVRDEVATTMLLSKAKHGRKPTRPRSAEKGPSKEVDVEFMWNTCAP